MRYLVTHPLPPGITRDGLEKMVKSLPVDPDIRGYRSFLNLSEGKGFCVFDAPDRTKLASWLTKNKLEYESIIEVELEGYRGEWVETETPVGTTA